MLLTFSYFELRKNKTEGGSALIQRYKVTKVSVYPPYLGNPTPHSGFDLAVGCIEVPEDDHYVQQLYSKYSDHIPRPLAGEYSTSRTAVVGFPGEYNGEKWGIVREIPIHEREKWTFKKDEQKDILMYDFIDTGPGQGGSPVMGMSPREVIGVHIGGNAVRKRKWATYLNPVKLKWIADTLEIPIKEDSNRLYLD
jgi:V8-like Glu-specific endopeptidase